MRIVAGVSAVCGALVLGQADRATAAPLCLLVQGIPDSCIYVDPRECQDRALQLGGICSANASEVQAIGNASYCTVDTSMVAQCIYPDRESCFAAAARISGACLVSRKSKAQALDPYLTTRPY